MVSAPMSNRSRARSPAEQWRDAYSLKQNYERCAVLEKMRRLPHRVLFQLAGKNRRFISRSRKIPKQLEYEEYVFASTARKGVMKDVVVVGIKRGARHLHIERIILCTEMRVARTPECYWIRQLIHAQAGYSPAIHVDEYLSGCTKPRFANDFEDSLPRLKGYKYRGLWVPCAWSAREYQLSDWKRRLNSQSRPQLEIALREFLEQYLLRKTSHELDREIQEALTPVLVKCLWIPQESVGELALRILQRFSLAHPEQAARHLIPLSVASEEKIRLHLIALLKTLVPDDRADAVWEIIQNLLRDPSAVVRRRAIESLFLQRGGQAPSHTFIAARLLADIAEHDPDRTVARGAAAKLAAYHADK
jgi:hypothetical protein